MRFNLPSWFEPLLKTAQDETGEPSAHAEANIIDSTAVGDKVRQASLNLFEREDGAMLELVWAPSDYKIAQLKFGTMQDAMATFDKMKGDLLAINKLVSENKMSEAESASQQFITNAAHQTAQPLEQLNTQPLSHTQARKHSCGKELKMAFQYGPYRVFECPEHGNLTALEVDPSLISKEAKVTMQNLFFSDVTELMEYQEKMKAMQPPAESTPGMPGAEMGSDSKLPPMLPPGDKGPLVETPAKPSALEQMVENKVKETVESSLDQRARAVFDDTHAETVKVLRKLGRSWEEIKDFFNRYLKYDWEDIDVFLDQFQAAEEGESRLDPGIEKVKDEIKEETIKEEPIAPPKLEPIPVPAASLKTAEADNNKPLEMNLSNIDMAEGADIKVKVYQEGKNPDPTKEKEDSKTGLSKFAELVRDADSLKKGDKVTLVRSVLSRENVLIPPTISGTIVFINEGSIIIESKVGRFTISRHDFPKLDKTAGLAKTAAASELCNTGACTECKDRKCSCRCHMKEADVADLHNCMLCRGKGEDPVRGGPCPECTPETSKYSKECDEGNCAECLSGANCACECHGKEATLETEATRYYLKPNAEYDHEADLVDEISGKYGDHKKKWDFTQEKWEIQYDPSSDRPYVEIKKLATTLAIKMQDQKGFIAEVEPDGFIMVYNTAGQADWTAETHNREQSIQSMEALGFKRVG